MKKFLKFDPHADGSVSILFSKDGQNERAAFTPGQDEALKKAGIPQPIFDYITQQVWSNTVRQKEETLEKLEAADEQKRLDEADAARESEVAALHKEVIEALKVELLPTIKAELKAELKAQIHAEESGRDEEDVA